jgi:hypothetical protein
MRQLQLFDDSYEIYFVLPSNGPEPFQPRGMDEKKWKKWMGKCGLEVLRVMGRENPTIVSIH